MIIHMRIHHSTKRNKKHASQRRYSRRGGVHLHQLWNRYKQCIPDVYYYLHPILPILIGKQFLPNTIMTPMTWVFLGNILVQILKDMNLSAQQRQQCIAMFKQKFHTLLRKHTPVISPTSADRIYTSKCDRICPICMEKESNLIFKCGHCMCKQCYNRLPKPKKCALCRQAIKKTYKIKFENDNRNLSSLENQLDDFVFEIDLTKSGPVT